MNIPNKARTFGIKWAEHLDEVASDRTDLALFLAALIGIVFAFSVLGSSYIFGTAPSWQSPESDMLIHVIGWLQYIKSGWHFPLFYVPELYYPEGISIILTDSLALPSFFSKIIYKFSGVEVNPFGYWTLICVALQPVTAVLLFRTLGVRSFLGNILVAILSLSLITFLMRVGQTASAQFAIIFSLYFYVKAANFKFDRMVWIAEIALLQLIMLIHLYLWAMCFPIFAVGVLQAVLRGHLRKVTGLLIFVGTVTITALWMFICGLIDSHTAIYSIGGFGSFSMNLLSPILPPPGTPFSNFFKDIPFDGTGAQTEGFNYLGAGVLLLLATLLVTRFKRLGEAIARHKILTALMVSFFVYSLSNRIFVGHFLIFSFHVPDFAKLVTTTFRVSGRIFWPVVYVLALFGAAATMLWLPRRVALPLLFAVAALNFYEMAGYMSSLENLAEPGTPQPLNLQAWENLMRGQQRVFQYPSFDCGGLSGQKPWPENYADYQISLAASRVGIPINSISSARPFKDCDREKLSIQSEKVDDQTLYVFSPTQGRPEQLIALGIDPAICRDFKRGVVCTKAFLTNPALDDSRFFFPLEPMKTTDAGQKITPMAKDEGTTLNWSEDGSAKTVVLEAPAFLSQIGQLENGLWHTAEDTSQKPGFLIYGPYITLPAGHYVFRLAYRLTSSSGGLNHGQVWWDIVSRIGAVQHGKQTLPETDVVNDAFGTAEMKIALNDSTPQLEMRVMSDGFSHMTIKRVLITKLKE
jgi:hypothetical protein